MIPKKIHYCWLSGEEFPDDIKKCMETWKKYLPDYEFVLWDSKKFDVDSVPFVKEAVSVKKWAFAADYIRLYAVFTEGGIYMDTDIIVKKSFDKFLEHDFFTAVEYNKNFEERKYLIQAALFGGVAGHPYIKDCMDWYSDKHLILPDGSLFNSFVAPDIYAEVAEKHGFLRKDERQDLDNGMAIYPSIVFTSERYSRSSQTYAIHWWKGTWRDKNLFKKFLSSASRWMFLWRHFGKKRKN
jgi:mannosyltransferase OCH1-like enzyme